MTMYLPNPLVHATGAEIEEFVDVLVPDPPLPPVPSRTSALSSPVDPDARGTGSRETPSGRSPT
jgi:hypothetical protein